MHAFSLKTKIISGENALSVIGTLGIQKACLVTDETMVKIGVVNQVTQLLDDLNINYEIFDSVEANPSLETVQNGLMHIIEYKPDALIAIGGGSVIDAAKAIVYFCLKTKKALLGKGEIHKPLFVAIPTTSGTGSEVTSFSVITDHKAQAKIALADEQMLPDVAVLDAAFTLSVPASVTADTGMDVITHALEALVSREANAFSDVYAQKSLELAFANLLKVYYNGQNRIARQHMHDASCMAGIAFTNAGLGITHSLAHVLGGRFKVSHGRANAILMPYVIAFNSGVIDGQEAIYGGAYDALAKKVGLQLDTPSERIKGLMALIRYYNEKMGIPTSLKTFGVDEKAFLEGLSDMCDVAIKDICTKSNPREVTLQNLKDILLSSYYGD